MEAVDRLVIKCIQYIITLCMVYSSYNLLGGYLKQDHCINHCIKDKNNGVYKRK